ncbi:MAG: hypothetical protein JWN78_364 [Bacteroidota bacterium]|nr:hypothetical protein [Bacteroidota bacterium]
MKPAKVILAIIILIVIFLTSCIKDDYPAKGFLVRYDPRDCACCGGLFVNLNNVDTVNTSTKLVNSLPVDFVFDQSELPLKVQFAWQNGGGCMANNIIITKIKRR